MNKLNYPTPSNGIRLFFDDLKYQLGLDTYDSGVIQSIQDFLLNYGTDFIVSGCEDLGGSVTADGWVMLGSELIRVKQHARTNNFFEKITETNTTGDRTDGLGGSVNVWEQIRATSSAASGNLRYDGIRLEDILDRTQTVRALTATGIYTIEENETLVTLTAASVSTTTITLPDASANNYGKVYSVYLNCDATTGIITIDSSAGTITTFAVNSLGYEVFILLRSSSSGWQVISQTANQTESNIRSTPRTILTEDNVGSKFLSLDTILVNFFATNNRTINSSGTYTINGSGEPTKDGLVTITGSNPTITLNAPDEDYDYYFNRIIPIFINTTGGLTFDLVSNAVTLKSISVPGAVDGDLTIAYKGGGEWYLLSDNSGV